MHLFSRCFGDSQRRVRKKKQQALIIPQGNNLIFFSESRQNGDVISIIITCNLLTFLRLESSRPRKNKDTKLHESFLDMEQQLDEIKDIQMVPDNILCASLEEQIVRQYCDCPVNLSSRNRRERV